MVRAAAKALNITTSHTTWEDFSQEADGKELTLPFLLSEAVLIREKDRYTSVVFSMKNGLLFDLLEEDSEVPYIVWDTSYTTGALCTQVAYATHDAEVVNEWIHQMAKPKMILNSTHELPFVMLVPLTSFV